VIVQDQVERLAQSMDLVLHVPVSICVQAFRFYPYFNYTYL